jgi:uncharacterized protein
MTNIRRWSFVVGPFHWWWCAALMKSLVRLSDNRPYKPLDFGNGLLAGSVAANGRLLSINSYQPDHGYMTLSALPPFAGDRHDPAAVRAYRAALAAPGAPTFGWHLPPTGNATVSLLAGAIPLIRWQAEGLLVEVTTWAAEMSGRSLPAAVQQWRLHNSGAEPMVLSFQWHAPVGLFRASYTQLTESGTLVAPAPMQTVTFDGRRLALLAPGLPAAAVIQAGKSAGPSSDDGPLPDEIRPLRLRLLPGQTEPVTFVYALGLTLAQAEATAATVLATDSAVQLAAVVARRQRRLQALAAAVANCELPVENVSFLARRALTYVLDCCALPVGEGACLLTDHQILPLSWTRDAYYLIQAVRRIPGLGAVALLRRHLIWLLETAQRPGGYWGRAYLANGQAKDLIFQLDQQCYPLLELSDYVRLTGDKATWRRLRPHLAPILAAILARQAPTTPLFATEETPADDPMPLPYHFSSQVLLWHTLRRLAELNGRFPFTTLDLAALSHALYQAILAHFVTRSHGRDLFAYATDGHGRYHLYHDANDLPLVWAPLWDFCSADDPVWRATLDFAFSPANRGGYYSGRYGGLGSIHTAGAWPLGDVQEWLYARLIGDQERAGLVLTRLAATAAWDGALPEARDQHSGAVRSRHWFAWPGAAFLLALLAAPD